MKFNPNCKKPNTCEECTDRCIKNIAFLYGLPEEKQIDILRHSTHKTLRRGDFVFHEGDSVESIVIIKQGQVKLSTYEADGRENIIGIFADNDTIWEGVFSAASSYPYSAVCLTKTYCCYIRRADVESAISDPKVALKVIHMLSNKLHDANERSRILSISEPVKRVAAFLIYREKRSNEPYFTLRLRKPRRANFLVFQEPRFREAAPFFQTGSYFHSEIKLLSRSKSGMRKPLLPTFSISPSLTSFRTLRLTVSARRPTLPAISSRRRVKYGSLLRFSR